MPVKTPLSSRVKLPMVAMFCFPCLSKPPIAASMAAKKLRGRPERIQRTEAKAKDGEPTNFLLREEAPAPPCRGRNSRASRCGHEGRRVARPPSFDSRIGIEGRKRQGILRIRYVLVRQQSGTYRLLNQLRSRPLDVGICERGTRGRRRGFGLQNRLRTCSNAHNYTLMLTAAKVPAMFLIRGGEQWLKARAFRS